MEKTSIIIPVKDALDYFKKCVESIEKYTNSYELVIIDNNSSKETKEFIAGLKATVIVNSENKGFPYGCNQGIKVAKYDYICFLNSDTFVTPNWLDRLQKCFEVNPDCGIASPSTCYSCGEQCDWKIAGRRFLMTEVDILNYAANLKEGYIQTDIYGFCMLTKKEILDKVGGFDYRRYGVGNTEELDLQWRMKQSGYKSYWVRRAYVHHYGHRTFEESNINCTTNLSRNRAVFEERKKDKNLFIENDVEVSNLK